MRSCSNCYLPFKEIESINGQKNDLEPGGISICINCGQVCTVSEDLKLVPMNAVAITQLFNDFPETYYNVIKTVREIMDRVKLN